MSSAAVTIGITIAITAHATYNVESSVNSASCDGIVPVS
jgi:hypothetical protein